MQWLDFAQHTRIFLLNGKDPDGWSDDEFVTAVHCTWSLLRTVARQLLWTDLPTRPEPDRPMENGFGNVYHGFDRRSVNRSLNDLRQYLGAKLAVEAAFAGFDKLSSTKKRILLALRGTPVAHTGEEIAQLAGVTWNSYCRDCLVGLREQGYLENLAPGYRLTSQARAYLTTHLT